VAALRRWAPALLALTLAGCASFVRLDSARTVGRGRRQVMLAPSVFLNQREQFLAGFTADLLWRFGLTDWADAGLRVHGVGVQADLKLALRRAPDSTRGVDLAIAPGVGAGVDINWMHQSGEGGAGPEVVLPLIIGVNLGQHQLVITPQLLYQKVATVPAGVLDAGLSLSFGSIEAAGFRVYPALALWKALEPRDLFGPSFRHGSLAIQPALVFRWGS
jgi:hypothetical protein